MKRYYQFDLIKFVASILIVFHHFMQIVPYENPLIKFYEGNINYGYLVELFFIISGILTGIKNERNKNDSFKSFMGRKLIRFLPMSMLSVCFFAIVLYIYYVVTGEWWNNGVVSVWLFFKSFLLIGTGGAIKHTWYLNPPTWYLSVLIICLGLYWIILKFTNRYSINYKL